jgi:hypothetical protein
MEIFMKTWTKLTEFQNVREDFLTTEDTENTEEVKLTTDGKDFHGWENYKTRC